MSSDSGAVGLRRGIGEAAERRAAAAAAAAAAASGSIDAAFVYIRQSSRTAALSGHHSSPHSAHEAAAFGDRSPSRRHGKRS